MRTPDSWRSARATLALAGATALAWVLVSTIGLDQAAANWAGFIPARMEGTRGDLSHAPFILTPLTATLVHAGFVHLAFNLLMLLFCGRAVETIIGMRGLLILYVAAAYVAAGSMLLTDAGQTGTMIGASGATSGVFGAYALLFSQNRVRVADKRVARGLHVLWMCAAWVGLQLIIGFITSGSAEPIAIAAHIGGFFAGLALAKPLLMLRYRRA